MSWSCDFEDDAQPICDMIQDTNTDQFDWTRQSGRTRSGFTGPNKAYTGKHYIYIEASDPRKSGDEAMLVYNEINVFFCLFNINILLLLRLLFIPVLL